MREPLSGNPIAPVVVAVRGPSGSGKTALIEQLTPLLSQRGWRVAYMKRTHHPLDLPEKGSGRVWSAGPAMMLLHSVDRLQLTLRPDDRSVEALLPHVPTDIDLVLLETHESVQFPAIVSTTIEPAPDEMVVGHWSLSSLEGSAAALAGSIEGLLPRDPALAQALRVASRAHGGGACAGLVLGTRLALLGAEALGIAVPDRSKRLIVRVETDRCAVDAIQAITGCRPGRRTLQLLDYGKLAATFIDQLDGRAVRVAARGDLRERVGNPPDGGDRHAFQRDAYLRMASEELFAVHPADPWIRPTDLPGSPKRRVMCGRCGEEVSDGREIMTEVGPICRPCASPAPAVADPDGG